MAQFQVPEKIKGGKTFNTYFALKSQNEIYYQMASIFKEIAIDEEIVAENILDGIIKNKQSKGLTIIKKRRN